MKTNGDDQVFPRWGSEGSLIKREYFAVLVMQGIEANSVCPLTSAERVEYAVRAADALIAELNKEPAK